MLFGFSYFHFFIWQDNRMENNMNSFTEMKDHEKANPHVFSIKLYLKIFVAVLGLLFVNFGIYLSKIPAPYSLMLLMFVALIQTTLVAMFFMELIHEDKFFTFIF